MLKKYLLIALLITPAVAARKLIKEVRVQNNRIDITINKKFKNQYLKDDFFVEYDTDVDLSTFDYSIITLPFIMNVASLVWISG